MKNSKEKRLELTAKAQLIINKLSLEEKVKLMGGSTSLDKMRENEKNGVHYNFEPYEAGGIKEKGVPKVKFCDGPRGVVCGEGKTTCFPVSMGRGATFNVELEREVGRVIGRETKASDGNLFAGVCINLPYHPGWGRSQETYGEDSFHIGQMGSALVYGVDDENVVAGIKHYAFNSMELARFKVDVKSDKRTEREVYLPAFKRCIEAGAGAVMTSYNAYNGSPCGHSNYLINEVLKTEWDFDGFVMSDFFWGIADTCDAANGGQDLEMCWTNLYGDKLLQAVKDGKVKETKIDEAVLRIVRTMLTTESNQEQLNDAIRGCKEHIDVALDCARESITLIKNQENILPLDKMKIKKIGVFGKLASKENIGDHGSSRVFPKYVVTPIEGLKTIGEKIEYVVYDGNDVDTAKELSKSCDCIIYFVGNDNDDEGEFMTAQTEDNYTKQIGGDRVKTIGLHDNEIKLINAVSSVNNNGIVVLIGGNTITVDEWEHNVKGILMAYYPGMEGGTALAEIIFGDVNPSGKLPFVIPRKQEHLPEIDWNAEVQVYKYYNGYKLLDKNEIEPYRSYGFGMSYTNFELTNIKIEEKSEAIKCTLQVSNTGAVDGSEVIQMYVGFNKSKLDRPCKALKAFKKIKVKSGETVDVELLCEGEELKYFNTKTNLMELEEMVYEIYIGTSSSIDDLIAVNINKDKFS